MITAKEARQLYNETVLLRDKYIREVLEPLIKKKAPSSKSVRVKAIGRYASDLSIDFPRPYAQYRVDVELTNAVVQMLIENGYKVHFACGIGTQMYDSEGELIISWE